MYGTTPGIQADYAGASYIDVSLTPLAQTPRPRLQISHSRDLEARLARYKAVGDVERLAHLSKENTRLAAYEGQYRTLLQSFDREVAAAVAAVEEAAAARGRKDARQEHQVRPTHLPPSPAYGRIC